jgi:hypothetical protein
VHGLTVGKQYNAQYTIIHLRYTDPTTNTPVRLHDLAQREPHGALDPFVAYSNAIGSMPNSIEVLDAFHELTRLYKRPRTVTM